MQWVQLLFSLQYPSSTSIHSLSTVQFACAELNGILIDLV